MYTNLLDLDVWTDFARQNVTCVGFACTAFKLQLTPVKSEDSCTLEQLLLQQHNRPPSCSHARRSAFTPGTAYSLQYSRWDSDCVCLQGHSA